MNKIICGVDVAKGWLDGHINDAAGIADLAAWCQSHGVELAVMEASDGCERLAFLLLWALSLACALVNARSVRRFAGDGLPGKDRQDQCRHDRRLRTGQARPTDAAAERGPAAARCLGGSAQSGHQRSHCPEAAQERCRQRVGRHDVAGSRSSFAGPGMPHIRFCSSGRGFALRFLPTQGLRYVPN